MTLLEECPQDCSRRRAVAVIKTTRLILRAPRADDAHDIANLANDRRIAENTARIPHPYALADAEQFIAAANKKDGESHFLATLRDGTLIGGCGIGKLFGKEPEIGYWFGVSHWGRGYATEVARALVDHAFTELGLPRLEGGARVSNEASRRVLEKCGFQWTRTRLLRVRALGSSVPVDRFRLDRSLWASLKDWGKAD
jgi:RimJ/RimL family protein N-acetyltransferase